MQVLWGLLLLFSVLAVPLLLGVLVYFRLRRFHDFVAHTLSFLLPPILFFYLACLFWVYLPAKAHPNESCGMPVVAAVMMVYLGTFITILGSLIFQLALHSSHRKDVAAG
jgi:heme/copper-type cytochrome/quinol oxidase subunit 3